MPQKNVRGQKQSNNSTHPIKKTNYQLISVVISIIAIVVSAIFSIFSIFKDGGMQRPILKYSIHQATYGQLLFEVYNSGNSTATNVTTNLLINPVYDVSDCVASPPFQDNQPIQTPISANSKQYQFPTITWRIQSIPQGASFYFSCSIYYTKANLFKVTNEESEATNADVLEFLLSQETIPVPTSIGEVCNKVWKTYTESVSEWELKDAPVSDIIFAFEVFAENSKPGKQDKNITDVAIWRPKGPVYIEYEIEYCFIAEK